MIRCDKLLADHNKCGKKVYKDGKCFPHWGRTVPKWYLDKLDREYFAQISHFAFQHSCPTVGTCYLHPRPELARTKFVN